MNVNVSLITIIATIYEKEKNMNILHIMLNLLDQLSKWISYLYSYRAVYAAVGTFATHHFPPTKRQHRYAILVAARNEEAVIGHLIDSIQKQDYPSDLVDIFVVADNCTDATASIVRRLDAICYERTDPNHRTKGFALQFLVEQIRRDYGIDTYDGYFIFDADNLLKSDYISRMNDAFDSGEKIITSYRNTKNFGDNWISASYGLHWLRTIRTEHRARSVFHLATRIQGTGFLFASELIKNGWNYTSLTEDRAFCADAVAAGYSISYQDAAEFYDEQPTNLRIVFRQRIRWAKGHLQAFAETSPKLFKHIFIPTDFRTNQATSTFDSGLHSLPDALRRRFMSFDMLTVVFPRSLISSFRKILLGAFSLILLLESKTNLPTLSIGLLSAFLLSYVAGIATAAYIFFIERRRLPRISPFQKIWYSFTFPLFDMIGRLAMIIALFIKVDWKPIPHTAKVDISEISTRSK